MLLCIECISLCYYDFIPATIYWVIYILILINIYFSKQVNIDKKHNCICTLIRHHYLPLVKNILHLVLFDVYILLYRDLTIWLFKERPFLNGKRKMYITLVKIWNKNTMCHMVLYSEFVCLFWRDVIKGTQSGRNQHFYFGSLICS